MSFLVLVIAGLTMLEVIERFVFNNPTIWVHETTAQIFGFYVIMGGGYLLLNDEHIRVDVFWSRLPPKKRVIADLCTFGFAFLFIAVLLWFSVEMTWNSILILERSSTPFSPPVYPLKIAMALGVFLLLLQLLAKFIRDLHFAITGVKSA